MPRSAHLGSGWVSRSAHLGSGWVPRMGTQIRPAYNVSFGASLINGHHRRTFEHCHETKKVFLICFNKISHTAFFAWSVIYVAAYTVSFRASLMNSVERTFEQRHETGRVLLICLDKLSHTAFLAWSVIYVVQRHIGLLASVEWLYFRFITIFSSNNNNNNSAMSIT